jgi:hypothetical protein
MEIDRDFSSPCIGLRLDAHAFERFSLADFVVAKYLELDCVMLE